MANTINAKLDQSLSRNGMVENVITKSHARLKCGPEK